MLSFNIPAQLNGSQLMKEFNAQGLEIEIPIIADGKLWLNVSPKDKAKAEAIVNNHVGVDYVPTIEDKLDAAGIDIDELRVALGL